MADELSNLQKAGIAVTLAMLLGGGIEFVLEDTYYCESRDLVAECSYLSGTLKTCYNPPQSSKRCTTDPYWQPIQDYLDRNPYNITPIKNCSTVEVVNAYEVNLTVYYNYTFVNCTDPPANTSCFEQNDPRADNVTHIIYNTSNKTLCEFTDTYLYTKEGQENKTFSPPEGFSQCSIQYSGDDVLLTCDSDFDSNRNGICEPGETGCCCTFNAFGVNCTQGDPFEINPIRILNDSSLEVSTDSELIRRKTKYNVNSDSCTELITYLVTP